MLVRAIITFQPGSKQQNICVVGTARQYDISCNALGNLGTQETPRIVFFFFL